MKVARQSIAWKRAPHDLVPEGRCDWVGQSARFIGAMNKSGSSDHTVPYGTGLFFTHSRQ